jgi:hypothetical protein
VDDYTFIWMSGKTEDEVGSYVPKVVETIVLTVEVINKPTTLLFPVHAVPCFLLRSSLARTYRSVTRAEAHQPRSSTHRSQGLIGHLNILILLLADRSQ